MGDRRSGKGRERDKNRAREKGCDKERDLWTGDWLDDRCCVCDSESG